MKEVGEGVNKAFKDVRIFALPHPGPNVVKASENDKSVTFSSESTPILHFANG